MRPRNLAIGVLVLLLAGMLSACDKIETDQSKVKNENFFMKDQVAAINKAKAVEGMMQEHVRQEMKEADAQSQ